MVTLFRLILSALFLNNKYMTFSQTTCTGTNTPCLPNKHCWFCWWKWYFIKWSHRDGPKTTNLTWVLLEQHTIKSPVDGKALFFSRPPTLAPNTSDWCLYRENTKLGSPLLGTGEICQHLRPLSTVSLTPTPALWQLACVQKLPSVPAGKNFTWKIHFHLTITLTSKMSCPAGDISHHCSLSTLGGGGVTAGRWA